MPVVICLTNGIDFSLNPHMSLQQYNKKRDFKKTAEPEGKEKSSKGSLRYVVQKHDASSVHYDFRLEMSGALKSWAVPKGPSLNPADKRLAMMVEDHPFSYRSFEGVIPAGEYGGGAVIVWDEGTYELSNPAGLNRKEQESALLQALKKGRISIVLHGRKLNGEFTLMQMRGRGENTWLLMKKKDEFSTTDDVTADERSVKSGKTLIDIAADNNTVVNHPDAHEQQKNKAKVSAQQEIKKGKSLPAKTSIRKLQKGSPSKAKSPQEVVPMLATLINEPFDDKGWLYEIKWDGYRAVAHCDGKEVKLVSRNLKAFTDRYTPIATALKNLKLNAVLDGEIVAIDENGTANFQLLQNWQNTPVRLQYLVFDVLWANGKDFTSMPLVERKALLQSLLPIEHDVIKYSSHVAEKGKAFFREAMKKGLEGIMAKKADSLYHIGDRTEDWVKIKVAQRQEVIIVGFTQPRRTRQFFGSLLLGVYDGKELLYVGHTGSGFTTNTLEEIYNKLQPLVTDGSPFAKTPKTNMPAVWVKPKLVCEIKFTEWTAERMARHPIFMGLRTDKKAADVVLEKTTTMGRLKSGTNTKAPAEKQAVKRAAAV
ncbi:MAG TPA: non-homologous end-joining DNA ligase, partial [Flavisolibacter sp.]|nr:non-homologous end-joining DNA ligase [Flavisolibacter sp.]